MHPTERARLSRLCPAGHRLVAAAPAGRPPSLPLDLGAAGSSPRTARRSSRRTAERRRPSSAASSRSTSSTDGCQSELEAHGVLDVFRHRSLPRSVGAVPDRPAEGRVRLDRAWPEVKLAVELDGARHHTSPEDRQRDLARDTALAALGWVVLRFTYADVMRDPGGRPREDSQRSTPPGSRSSASADSLRQRKPITRAERGKASMPRALSRASRPGRRRRRCGGAARCGRRRRGWRPCGSRPRPPPPRPRRRAPLRSATPPPPGRRRPPA